MTVVRDRIPPGMRLHPLRAGDLTASQIGAAIGVDPHCPRLRVWAEKTGLAAPQAENASMRRGRRMEGAVAMAFREEYPLLRVVYPLGWYLRDPEINLGATPDLLAEDPAEPGLINVQLKVISAPVFERDWHDGPPLHYELQTITEGMLLDARTSKLAVLVVDTFSDNLEVFDVPRHPDAEARIRQVAVEFWDDVRAGRQPAVDYSRDADTIKAMYPRAEPGSVLDLSADNFVPQLIADLVELKKRIALDEHRLEAIETQIKTKLGTAEVAELPGWRITWKNQNRKGYVVQPTTSRPLFVREIKQKELAA